MTDYAPDLAFVAKVARLKETNEKLWRWVWTCAEELHFAYGYDVKAAFDATLEFLPEDDRCEACDLFCVFPEDHLSTCPLAENDDPKYAAYCIQGNAEADAHPVLSEATSPAGWRHP